ncbi:M1 family metallopeptidase [uncultured Imperialibacter sp.]|uniref:M1 family metallopeptidase n=1 Tax=uncultured Imperialibacter sp. TaxID=1672639 RepID=UPI0030DCC8AD|tara:strand:- start:31669 stop:33555 length:1887 start_codon:yes stop_codon:yes gene_type:complete
MTRPTNLNLALLFTFLTTAALAQPDRWQQRVEYTMDIDMDVSAHQFKGKQKLVYYNNSPDTLTKVFYHLYFNAFQPGSSMDVRSRTIADPDRRVMDRIYHLKDDQIGYQKINSLKQDGKVLSYAVEGTVLEVNLAKPILPKSKVTFDMEFDAQVPLQVRRSGWANKEGVEYSMAQWYPKMAEYDYEGWHADPYVGREFYAPWGDFNVNIAIDSAYMIGGSGYLQNPEQIGKGYAKPGTTIKRPKGGKLTWQFKAQNVHDFMWAADPDYLHDVAQVPGGPALHFFYQGDTLVENWKELQGIAVKAFDFLSKNFGKYPYDKFAVVQGGDGGMEYPMSTLITGHRSVRSLVGVTVHEALHSWYQGVLGTNESLYPWMDEGFTDYATQITMHYLFDGPNGGNYINPLEGSYRSYFSLAQSGLEEPMSTHSDHYNTNRAYGSAAYSKGAVSQHQLSYVVGHETFMRGLRRYFDTWKMKHPNMNDYIRIQEKNSGLELDWYYEYFVNSTKTVDYGIKSVEEQGDQTNVTLERIEKMPMPIELYVEYADGSKELFYIPLDLMRGVKEHDDPSIPRTILTDWPWTHPYYTFSIPKKPKDIRYMEIDPTQRMADTDRTNQSYPWRSAVEAEGEPVNK